jgi:clan AA aspartic protease (TIGR02281 family)
VLLSVPGLVPCAYACWQLSMPLDADARAFWIEIGIVAAAVFLVVLFILQGGRGVLYGGLIWLFSLGVTAAIAFSVFTTLLVLEGEGAFSEKILGFYAIALLFGLASEMGLRRLEEQWVPDTTRRRLQFGIILILVGLGITRSGVRAGWFESAGFLSAASASAQEYRVRSYPRHRLVGQLGPSQECYVRGTVNGVPMVFFVDTGSVDISFNRALARKIGIDPARLRYDLETATANGTGHAARVTLDVIRFGDFVVHGEPADVDYNGYAMPLLGMSLLQFMHLQIGHGQCVLTW